MYLQELHGHENIVEILNVLKAENDQDIYIVTDFMESDLHAVIKAGILQDVHQQYVIYQLVRALKYMHSGELIHRDIKPSNVLLKSDCSIKLCDFGLARSVAPSASAYTETHTVMTDYVATRWYRAPELLLGSPQYTKGVDIWAVGCILAEMIVGKPVFPGTSTLDQLERVIAITGQPSGEDLESLKSSFAPTMLGSIKVSKRRLSDVFPRASSAMLDFMQRCFEFNPTKRASAEELLHHPLLAQFHDPKSEPDAKAIIRIPLDDNVKLTATDYRTRLYELVIQKKRDLKHVRREVEVEPGTPRQESPGLVRSALTVVPPDPRKAAEPVVREYMYSENPQREAIRPAVRSADPTRPAPGPSTRASFYSERLTGSATRPSVCSADGQTRTHMAQRSPVMATYIPSSYRSGAVRTGPGTGYRTSYRPTSASRSSYLPPSASYNGSVASGSKGPASYYSVSSPVVERAILGQTSLSRGASSIVPDDRKVKPTPAPDPVETSPGLLGYLFGRW